MTAPAKRYTVELYPGAPELHEVVLAGEYERLEQEFERLRLDNLSKNGSMKAFGAQIAALQRAVKNRDKLKAKAESERDELRGQVEALVEALVRIKFRADSFVEDDAEMQPHSAAVISEIARGAISAYRAPDHIPDPTKMVGPP